MRKCDTEGSERELGPVKEKTLCPHAVPHYPSTVNFLNFCNFDSMTIKELKSEIQKSLDNVPESVLTDILALLKQAEGQPDKIKLTRNLRDILAEDKNLLERLAK